MQTIPMFNKSSPIATCQESFLDTCHTNCCRKKTPQEANWPMVDSFTLLISKPKKIHSCRSPIFHYLCSHHNRFISHHYYILTSHILSTFEFHVGSIFHYDSSQSFILFSYWMMWNSLRSTFQWSCPINSDTLSQIEIRVL